MFQYRCTSKILLCCSSAGSYLFVSHTGFGGVAYAMAIICIRLDAGSKLSQPLLGSHIHAVTEENLPSRASNETALSMGDYSDILNLTRVLIHGPQSKADVDLVIERLLGIFFISLQTICCYF